MRGAAALVLLAALTGCQQRAPLPARADVVATGHGSGHPVRLTVANTASQVMPRAGVLDPEREWVYDPLKGFSKSHNSPWAGKTLRGRAIATVVAGRLVYDVDRGVLAP